MGKAKPIDPVAAALGARLRARRVALKMSRGALGRAMRTAPELIEQYEAGARTLRGHALTRACRALGVDAEFLLAGRTSFPAAREGFDAGAMEILNNWRRIKASSLGPYVARMMDALAAAGDMERMPSLRANEYDLLNALPVAIYTTDAEGRLTYFNEAAVRFAGRRPRLMADRWCVSWKLYTLDGVYLPHAQCPMAIALQQNRVIRGASAIAERPDGSRIVFRPHPTPLRDHAGAVRAGVNLLLEIPPPQPEEPAPPQALLH